MSEAANAIQGLEGSGFYLISGVTLVGAALAVVVLRRINWL
jgi:hypothetical protein